jgi:hypothetical protein
MIAKIVFHSDETLKLLRLRSDFWLKKEALDAFNIKM